MANAQFRRTAPGSGEIECELFIGHTGRGRFAMVNAAGAAAEIEVAAERQPGS